MKKLLAIFLLISLLGCKKEIFTVERLVNAVWSSDDMQVLKVYSLYDTPKLKEPYYYAPSGENWCYRFELCDSTLSNSQIVGEASDIDQGGDLEYTFLYWLPPINKMVTINPGAQGVLREPDGSETVLAPPNSFIEKVYAITEGSYSAVGIAPSPNEETIAVYYQAAYSENGDIFNMLFLQNISFFDSKTGTHIFSQEIPDHELVFSNTDHHLTGNRIRNYFLWSKDNSGVYIVSRSKSYFINCSDNKGIHEVTMVPERPTVTNSGEISNKGKQLFIDFQGNSSSLSIVQITDWIPFNKIDLIPCSENEYSDW